MKTQDQIDSDYKVRAAMHAIIRTLSIKFYRQKPLLDFLETRNEIVKALYPFGCDPDQVDRTSYAYRMGATEALLKLFADIEELGDP